MKFNPEKINEGNAGLGKSLESIKAAEGKISECKAGLDSRINVDIPDVGEEAGKIGTCSRAIGNIYMDFKVANSKTNKKSLEVGETVTLDVDKNALPFGIASNAYDASKGDFIPEENVFKEYWADENGQLEFTKIEDGTYLITKNGIPMGYTDQEGFDSVYAASQSKDDSKKKSGGGNSGNKSQDDSFTRATRNIVQNSEYNYTDADKKSAATQFTTLLGFGEGMVQGAEFVMDLPYLMAKAGGTIVNGLNQKKSINEIGEEIFNLGKNEEKMNMSGKQFDKLNENYK